VVVAGSAVVLVLLGLMAMRSGWGVVNFQSVFQKIRAAIPTAAEPQTAPVTKSEDLGKPEAELPPLKKPSESEGVPAPSLKPSASAPKPAPLPQGLGHPEVEEPVSPGEPPALSPTGPSEMQPGSPGEPKQAAEIATKKEEPAKPQGPPLSWAEHPHLPPGPPPPLLPSNN
jgi:hypothetical protein